MGLIVVTGPPAAGKSTWVRSKARPGDIVIDYDRLAQALQANSGDTHDHPKAVRAVAFRARSAAIEEALQHRNDVDVYVIHSLPPSQISRRYEEHDATVVVVDPGKDVVLARIAEQRPHTMIKVAERWYATQSNTASSISRSSRKW